MSEGMGPAKPSPGWTGWTARVLTIVFGAYWTLFGFVAGMNRGAAQAVTHALFPGVALLVGALIAWFGRKAGGGVILVVGLVATWFYILKPGIGTLGAPRVIALVVILALPPIVSGLLLLIGKDRQRGA
jgi:hypothetical protein